MVIMAVSLVFSGCNTEEEVYASLLDKEKASMGAPLELSANDVLVNGDLWNYVRTIRYTEPEVAARSKWGSIFPILYILRVALWANSCMRLTESICMSTMTSISIWAQVLIRQS